ncbi:MAG: hypothetical protein GVY32_03335, partial [Gammaproteobacteria bacterium]|nr:hypothetical protein [Gammaproteobacteria bacterium]
MPLVDFDREQDTVLNFTPQNPKPQLDGKPSLLDQTLAAFQLENVAVNAYQRATEDLPEDRDPAFDPRDHLRPGEEIVASRFADDQSVQEMNQTRARVERERKARETLGAGGPVSATALSMLAAGADITSLIPFGGGFGRSVAVGAARGVASGAAANAVGEAALQGLQETRTFYESLAAVTVGGVLGGGLGAAGAVVSRGSGRAGALDDPATQAAIDDMRATYEANAESPFNTSNITESVGAAVARAAPEDSLLANTAGAQPIMAALGRVGLEPAGFRLARSNFASVREASSQLIDTGLITQGNVRGYTSGAPVETVIKGETA